MRDGGKRLWAERTSFAEHDDPEAVSRLERRAPIALHFGRLIGGQATPAPPRANAGNLATEQTNMKTLMLAVASLAATAFLFATGARAKTLDQC